MCVCVCVPPEFELSAVVSSRPVCMGSAVWPMYVCKQDVDFGVLLYCHLMPSLYRGIV